MDPAAGLGARLASGDELALEQCYAEFSRPVLAFLRRYVGPDEAEDVLQRTFLSVWQSRERYDPARPLSTWVLTIAHHRAVDAVRRRQPAVVTIDSVRDLMGEDGRATAERYAWAADVRAALDRLPDNQREALELAYFGGRTQTEIASELDVPLGTIKARMSRGMRALAELVAPDAEDR